MFFPGFDKISSRFAPLFPLRLGPVIRRALSPWALHREACQKERKGMSTNLTMETLCKIFI
jgi:hypothetical protein